MSANKHTNPAYISHVHLKGYKSIIDTEVVLHPGLNIIIGPNGSGKTNFLEYLDKIILLQNNEIPNEIEGELKFFFKENTNYYSYTFKRLFELNEKSNKLEGKFKEQIFENDDFKSGLSGNGNKSVLDAFYDWREFYPVFLKFGLPLEIQNLSKSLSIIGHPIFKENKESPVAIHFDFNVKLGSGLKKILADIFNSKIDKEFENHLENVEINLKKFSPIESIRIVPRLKIVKDKSDFRADYINFEFRINDKWLNWNQLSDGTKRLFYIITEVTLNEGLCLVEEPELGTYPNQYDKILNFLKEQAEEKQIIITTHSPRTLDILEDEELNRIILTRYDRELGTKMRHLNEAEIDHAKNKEDGLFLSDLWTWTSFFDEEETVI